jgi:hypothetical protein
MRECDAAEFHKKFFIFAEQNQRLTICYAPTRRSVVLPLQQFAPIRVVEPITMSAWDVF